MQHLCFGGLRVAQAGGVEIEHLPAAHRLHEARGAEHLPRRRAVVQRSRQRAGACSLMGKGHLPCVHTWHWCKTAGESQQNPD